MDIEKEVERQLNILKRGVEEIISEEELKKKIEKSLKTGKPLKIKLGIDPTGSEIHLGHAVPIRKLKQFQDLGHTVQLLLGTFTAKIGDPTGKSETRKMLSDDDIQNNIKGYIDQIRGIIDVDKIEVKYNADWLAKLSMEDILKLMAQFTVSQMISREDFAKRLKENKPVSLVEFMYPILQGYDSVALDCDIEIGATEQKFNILRGRDLLKNAGKEPQICMLLPILEGLDGVNKMSKSLNNYIGVKEDPNDMFGKTMSISDEMMYRYYELATDVSLEEIKNIRKGVEDGSYHPMEAKKRLGTEIVKIYHGEEEAIKARAYFESIFSRKEIHEDIKEVKIGKEEISVIEILTNIVSVSKSNSEAKRLIQGNGVKINGETITDISMIIKVEDGMVFRAGKKCVVKLLK